MREQFKHDLKGGEGFGSPVDGNEGKESMFNLVPFAGGRRIMSHGDHQLFFIGQFLQLFLPEPISCPLGATSIGCDQQLLFSWIEHFATALPPPSDALHRKLGRIMVNPNIDKPALVDQILDAIGHRFAIGQGKKVVHIDAGVLSFSLPFTPIVLKSANQFLFLTIH